MKRKKINIEELDIGEEVYVGSSINQIKQINEKEFLFIRKDTITSHIDSHHSRYTLNDIKEKIISNLDHDLKYGEERTDLVNRLIDNNSWVYDLLSDTKIIQKEIKKKSSKLSEDENLDKLWQKVSSYITFPKFKNAEDEQKYNELKQEQNDLRSKGKLNSKEKKRLIFVEDALSLYNNKLDVDLENDFEEIEIENTTDNRTYTEIFEGQDIQSIKRKRYYKKQKFDVTFWKKMGYSDKEKDFRNSIINNYQKDIQNLERYFGLHIKNKEDREKFKTELIESYEQKSFEIKNKTVNYDKNRQFAVLYTMYKNIKGDFNKALEILTDQINFKAIGMHTTNYEWFDDTYYINESNEVVELSKNRTNYNDSKLYKGLLLNYIDLKEKYISKQNEDMWAVLNDFESLLSETELTEAEKFICSSLLQDKEIKFILNTLQDNHDPDMNLRKLYRYIDNYIPTKLKNKYIQNIDEYLYTHKIKGQYKKCNCCREIKLISNDRYFRKRKDNFGDGFYNQCRKCEN